MLTPLSVSFLLLLLPLLHKGSGDSWCVDRDNGMEDKATGLRGGPITQGQRFVMYEVGEHQLRGNALHLGMFIKYFSLYSVYIQCTSFAKLTFYYPTNFAVTRST